MLLRSAGVLSSAICSLHSGATVASSASLCLAPVSILDGTSRPVASRRLMSRRYFPKPHPPGKWRIVGATILERPSLVLADPEPWEAPFVDWSNARQAQEKKIRGAEFNLSETVVGQYFQRVDRRVKELDPTPRETEADRRNNVKSLRRALPHRLFLIVKKDRADNAWQFPQGEWQEGQTIRQTAELSLKEIIGDKLQTWYISNAPSVHVEYYSTPEYKEQTGYDGTKVFFMRAYQMGGPLKLPAGITDFAWLKHDELESRLSSNTWERMKQALTPY